MRLVRGVIGRRGQMRQQGVAALYGPAAILVRAAAAVAAVKTPIAVFGTAITAVVAIISEARADKATIAATLLPRITTITTIAAGGAIGKIVTKRRYSLKWRSPDRRISRLVKPSPSRI